MDDPFAADVAAVGRIAGVREMLSEVCRITGMRFAAVARVTDGRWIACQVQDGIDFGLDACDELEVATTICNEIRGSREGVFIDNVSEEPHWRVHHTPVMYGFQSYISLPIVRGDGSFFGTLCAIDPEPRSSSLAGAVAAITGFADRIAVALDGQAPGHA